MEPAQRLCFRIRRDKRVVANQDSGETHEGVQQSDELWHLRHLNVLSLPQADARTDAHRQNDENRCHQDALARFRDQRFQDGRGQRNRHADDAEVVALLGGLVAGQALQREDEEHGRHNVGESHHVGHPVGALFHDHFNLSGKKGGHEHEGSE